MRLLLPLLAGAGAAAIIIVTWFEHESDEERSQRPAFLSMTPAAGLDPKIEALVRRLASPNPSERADAAIALRQLRDASAPAVQYLVCLLEDRIPIRVQCDDDGTESGAIDQGGRGRFTCPGALAAGALTTSEPGVRALLRTISTSKSDDARRSALEGASCSTDPRLLDTIAEALSHETSLVRESAQIALIRAGPRAIDVLAARLRSKDETARLAAARILARFDDPRSLQVLLRAADDSASETRSAGEMGLRNINPGVAIVQLIVMFADPQLRDQAALVVQRLDHPQRTWLLVDALQQSRDPEVRAIAARVLGLIGDPASANALGQAREDPSAPVREEATRAFAALTRPQKPPVD